jgi:hypothetical protein
VERRQQHAVLGVDKDFRDKVKEAESSLGLTKDVRELQQVMRQVVTAIQGLEKNDFDQEARMVLAVQRVEGLDPKILGLETADEQQKGSIKVMGNVLTDRLRDFEREIGGKDKVLYAALAAQEGILTERIDEIKATFLKCEDVFAKKDDGAPVHATLPPGFGASLAMRELSSSCTILRGTVDALQVEVNQLRVEILECQDNKVPTELALQEFGGQLSSFQTWTLQEVLEGRGKTVELTGHVKVALGRAEGLDHAGGMPLHPADVQRLPKRQEPSRSRTSRRG